MKVAECISAAQRLAESRVAKQRRLFEAELRSLKVQLVKHRYGSWYLRRMHEICVKELETRAGTVFGAFEESLCPSSVWVPHPAPIVRSEFESELKKQTVELSKCLEDAKRGENGLRAFTLAEEESRLAQEYRAKIDLTWQKPGQQTQEKGTFVMNDNRHITVINSTNVQTGDQSSQLVEAWFTTIAEAVEKSNAPAEQKAEAKGRILVTLKHPAVVAVLGGVSQALLKKLLPP